jgi:hypothetical protein
VLFDRDRRCHDLLRQRHQFTCTLALLARATLLQHQPKDQGHELGIVHHGYEFLHAEINYMLGELENASRLSAYSANAPQR